MKSPVPLDQLRRIFSDVFEVPVEQVSPSSSPDNIPTWDSMRHLNLVVALEQAYEVQFNPEEIEQLLTFELIADILTEKCHSNGSEP